MHLTLVTLGTKLGTKLGTTDAYRVLMMPMLFFFWGGASRLQATVANTGAVGSKAVVAVYFSMPMSARVRYHKMLAGFAKSPVIPAGGTASVTIAIPISRLSSFDPVRKARSVEPGAYVLEVACDQAVQTIEGLVVSADEE